MDRRKFCKITALLAAGAAIAPTRLFAGEKSNGTSKFPACKIQVLRKECFYDLQSRYLDDPETGPCNRFQCGQEIIVTNENISGFEQGNNFCPKAWACIRQHVHDALDQSSNTCGITRSAKSAIACCSDGTRPVIFKITPL